MSDRHIRVGITHGDINGIGYEVILKTLQDDQMLEFCTPVLYGSAKIASFYRKLLGENNLNVQFTRVDNGEAIVDGHNNIINVVPEDVKIEPGLSTEAAGEAAFAALQRATDDLVNGNIDVLVTAPINKHNIQSADFQFPGHTEYLQARFGGESEALMMMCSEDMRVALVTAHLPLSQVPAAISEELILHKLEILKASLKRDFGLEAPRIAVLSLNPHAGEDGLLGTEEKEIIEPAIAKARQNKILAFGPYAADGFFGAAQFKKFDGILAMYHDQGLAPFKTLSMDAGVNFTAGLPFVRTSPDHGTGYDIAGKDLASPASMRQAIFAAIDIFRSRRNEDECNRHPLRKQYHAKGNDNVVLDLSKE